MADRTGAQQVDERLREAGALGDEVIGFEALLARKGETQAKRARPTPRRRPRKAAQPGSSEALEYHRALRRAAKTAKGFAIPGDDVLPAPPSLRKVDNTPVVALDLNLIPDRFKERALREYTPEQVNRYQAKRKEAMAKLELRAAMERADVEAEGDRQTSTPYTFLGLNIPGSIDLFKLSPDHRERLFRMALERGGPKAQAAVQQLRSVQWPSPSKP